MADKVLFSDDVIQLLLAQSPVVKGHLLVKPVRPDINLALMNDVELFEFFVASSNAATALFELIGAQGTNILVDDGETLQASVIARTQTDGIDILWQPTKADAHELDAAAKAIKDEVDVLVWQRDNNENGARKDSSPTTTSQPAVSQTLKEPSPEEKKEGKINYLLHRLRRRP